MGACISVWMYPTSIKNKWSQLFPDFIKINLIASVCKI